MLAGLATCPTALTPAISSAMLKHTMNATPANAAQAQRTMLAARLHGPRELRVEEVPHPGPPGGGEVLLRITAVGICGSDLNAYATALAGDRPLPSPITLGHEFAGVVEAAAGDTLDGNGRPLTVGMRVAVDPAQPCGRCELCQRGHPNLCEHLHFCGLWPDDGALCQWIRVPASSCFPVPETLDDVEAAMLEPLGVALHAVDLAKIRVGSRVAILGAGPIGLCILQLVRLSGAGEVFVSDKFPWRLETARRLGATLATAVGADPVASVLAATGGRGVDVAIEAAWCDESLQQAADMLANGGRLTVAGIPHADRMMLRHSVARRKGLSIIMVRRMKHAYPRAMALAERRAVDLRTLVTHCFPLEQAAEAFALNAAYGDSVLKAVVRPVGQIA
jgi:L-iditol 2-dehydrogenase